MSKFVQNEYFDVEVFRALSDETRLEIVAILGNKEMNVSDIAMKSSVSRPTISHHLQILKRAGILMSRKEGKEIYYSVNLNKFTLIAQGILNYVTFKSFE